MLRYREKFSLKSCFLLHENIKKQWAIFSGEGRGIQYKVFWIERFANNKFEEEDLDSKMNRNILLSSKCVISKGVKKYQKYPLVSDLIIWLALGPYKVQGVQMF